MLGKNVIGLLFALVYTLQVTAQYSSSCAEECATQAYDNTDCSDPSDYECICSNGSFPAVAYDCLAANCPDEIDSAEADYNAACTGVTSTTTDIFTSTSDTETLVYTTSGSESISSSSGYVSSSSPSSGYPTSSSSSSYSSVSYPTTTPVTPTPSGYGTPTPSGYGGTNSTSKSSVAVTSSSSTAPTGAAGRSALLRVGFVELMAVMVAMTML